MTRLNWGHWSAEAEPGVGVSVVEAVLAPMSRAVGIRSDDRISAGVDATLQGALVVTLESKPPGEWQWSGSEAGVVDLVREPSGGVRCHLLPAGHSERRPGDDHQAALLLGVDRHTWLAVRAIVETGLADAARMTVADLDRATDRPLRLNPQAVARRLAELITQADMPAAARSMHEPGDSSWETIGGPPLKSGQRAVPPIRRGRPLGPAL